MPLRFRNLHTTSPSDVYVNDAFAVKVVAVVGRFNDWAAYCGQGDWSDEQVAIDGDKLTREQAEPLFYVMRASGRHYRD